MTSIAIVDYGMGNYHSVERALRHAAPEADIRLCKHAQDIDAADLNHFIQNPAIFWPKVASAQEMLRENYTITAIENLWVSSLT